MTWFANVVLSLTGTLVLVVVFVLPALEASTPLGIVVPGEVTVESGKYRASRRVCRPRN